MVQMPDSARLTKVSVPADGSIVGITASLSGRLSTGMYVLTLLYLDLGTEPAGPTSSQDGSPRKRRRVTAAVDCGDPGGPVSVANDLAGGEFVHDDGYDPNNAVAGPGPNSSKGKGKK